MGNIPFSQKIVQQAKMETNRLGKTSGHRGAISAMCTNHTQQISWKPLIDVTNVDRVVSDHLTWHILIIYIVVR